MLPPSDSIPPSTPGSLSIAPDAAALALDDPQLYINRELSWLEFNQRVMDEARDPKVPLIERLKFAAITANNLDEFFMVRVAGFLEQRADAVLEHTTDGLSPSEQLSAIAKRTQTMIAELSSVL